MKQFEKYIALLRGINVSGQKIIKMAELRSILEELNFNNIKTYIQSGNIIFESKKHDTKHFEKIIKQKIFEHYGFNVPIIVKTFPELEKIAMNNPFKSDSVKSADKICVTFLSDIPSKEISQKFGSIKHGDEEFILDGENIYLYAPNGFGRTKPTNKVIEKKLQVNATSRNWKTINNLIEMAKEK